VDNVGRLKPTTPGTTDPGPYVATPWQFIPFIKAANYTPNTRGKRTLNQLVVHVMQNTERPNTARGVALWFAGKTTAPAPKASANYCIDSVEIIQCVKEEDVAWGVAGSNSTTIHLEHAGMSEQSRQQWADEYSTKMLDLSAKLAARIAARHGIPTEFCDAEALKAGKRGITGHVHMRDAFGKTTHWDPGPNFPWESYIASVQKYAAFIPGGSWPAEP
jgi:N-acetyl-anhydromuramyl-L-alanine amidase AmpD